jgi:hypothetical protein
MEVPLSVSAGDELIVTGEIEVTNDLPYAVEVCRKLTWERFTGGINGEVITPEAGENVSPQVWQGQGFPGQHHMLIPFSSMWVAPRTESGFISLVMYAGGCSHTNPNEWVSIELNTNHLSIKR